MFFIENLDLLQDQLLFSVEEVFTIYLMQRTWGDHCWIATIVWYLVQFSFRWWRTLNALNSMISTESLWHTISQTTGKIFKISRLSLTIYSLPHIQKQVCVSLSLILSVCVFVCVCFHVLHHRVCTISYCDHVLHIKKKWKCQIINWQNALF